MGVRRERLPRDSQSSEGFSTERFVLNDDLHEKPKRPRPTHANLYGRLDGSATLEPNHFPSAFRDLFKLGRVVIDPADDVRHGIRGYCPVQHPSIPPSHV